MWNFCRCFTQKHYVVVEVVVGSGIDTDGIFGGSLSVPELQAESESGTLFPALDDLMKICRIIKIDWFQYSINIDSMKVDRCTSIKRSQSELVGQVDLIPMKSSAFRQE